MTSPGSKVIVELMKAMSAATEWMILEVLLDWTTSPFNRAVIASRYGSPIRSAGTTRGPIGPKVS